jgi:peptide/nickel transport system substrate-binding protein
MSSGFRLVGLLSIILPLMACAGSAPSDGTRAAAPAANQPAGQITLGSSEEPEHLNPLYVLPHHFPQHAPFVLVFDSLLQIAPDGSLRPRLAASWEAAPDNLSLTFHLDSRARWHDGQPVTAADVAFTFTALADPAQNTAKDGTEALARVEALDAQTVRFTLKRVDPLFLPKAGSRAIVPEHLLAGQDPARASFNQQPVGSGPYRFVSWQPASAIVMDANPDYFLGPPKIGRVVFKVVPDQNVLVAQLRAGEVDYGLVEPRDARVVEGIAAVRLAEAPSPRYYSIGLNLRLPIFQDRTVREALLLATPRQELVDQVLEGHGTVLHSNATPASWAYNPDVPQYPYDPGRARTLLTAAGWAPGGDGVLAKNGQRLAFAVAYVGSEKQTEQALVVLQQRYKAVGVAITLQGLEASDLLSKRWPKGEFEASFQLWNPVYDPDQNSTFRSRGGYNGTGYSNPAVDGLFDEALSTLDQAARKRAYGQIQAILAQDLPMLWLYSNNEVHALSRRIAGFQPHPINSFWNLPDWMLQ